MSNININIPESVISDIADEVKTMLDYEELAESVATNLDADELIANVSRSVMEDMVHDNIDYDRVYDAIRDDVFNQIDSSMTDNVNDAVYSLLSDFLPSNACGTGEAFMEAIQKTIIHLLEQPANVIWLQDKLGIEEPKKTEEVTSTAEVKDENDQPVGLFNPDVIGIYEVVRKISDNYLTEQQIKDPSFLINLQMEMWNTFVNSRISYIESVNEGVRLLENNGE
jgi:hypothetical protein